MGLANLEPLAGAGFAMCLAYLALDRFRYRDEIEKAAGIGLATLDREGDFAVESGHYWVDQWAWEKLECRSLVTAPEYTNDIREPIAAIKADGWRWLIDQYDEGTDASLEKLTYHTDSILVHVTRPDNNETLALLEAFVKAKEAQ